MLAIDEAKLDNLYQQVLQIETDMMLEREGLEELSRVARLKVRRGNQAIRTLRESQRDELLECARSIFQWVSDFAGSPKGRKVLSTLGEVTVFRGHYFDCKPREEREYEAWLSYDRSGLLRYRELYKGSMHGRRSKVLSSPEQMVSRLHPNYIFSVLDSITTGQVWKEVECAIRWRAEIFDIRRQRGWWPPQPSDGELELS